MGLTTTEFKCLSDEQLVEYVFSTEFSHDPYPLYQFLRNTRPVWYVDRMDGWWVTRHEDVMRVLKKADLFTVDNYEWQINPVHGRTILAMKGKEHTKKRALVLPFFHGERLYDVIRPMIDSIARRSVEKFASNGHVELVSEFSRDFPLSVIAEMLGVIDEPTFDFETFQSWADNIIAYSANFHDDPDITARGLQTREDFSKFILPIINTRRIDGTSQGDLLSNLIDAEFEGVQLSDEEIRSFCSLILTAGYETTDKLITNSIVNLLDHPALLSKTQADRSLVDCVVAETMRRDSPVHVLARDTAEEVEVQGITIPAGDHVIIMTGSANRDERIFEEPDNFSLDRSDLDFDHAFNAGANHAGFGNGRHFCVGSELGRLEAVAAINYLLDAMPNARYPDGFTPQYEGLFAASSGSDISTVRSVRYLPITFDV